MPVAPVINTVATDGTINASETASNITGTCESGATVTLSVGGVNRASTVSGTSWSYTLVAADITNMGQGAETLSVIQKDAAGNTSPAGTRTITVDTTAPVAPVINTVATDDTINALETGGTISGSCESGATVILSIGGVSRTATVSGATWSYTLVAADITNMGQGAETLSATQTDAAGNKSPAGTRSMTVDTAAPAVNAMALTIATGIQNKALNPGDVVTAEVTMSEAVFITGTPTLKLNIGSSLVDANYLMGSGTSALSFAYTIVGGQTDTNGISIDTNALTLRAATIKDAAGNNVTISSAAVTDNAGYLVDTTAPTVATFSPADEATAVAIGADIVVTFSESVQRGSGNIVLKTSAGAVVATYDSSTSINLSISGSTFTINPSADLVYSTGYKVEFGAGTIQDIAGNSYAAVGDYNFTTTSSIVNGTSKSDNLVGTYASDSMFGLADNDTLDGGAGNDTLTGGLGADTFVVGAGADTVTDLGNGADNLKVATGAAANASIYSAWTATATTTNSGVAAISTSAKAVNLSAVTTGAAGFSITNTGAATTLTGSALADTLTGGSGTDTLVGGLGNDTYIVDSTTDVITELLNGGTDTVVSSVTQTTLASNVENLTLTGTAAINATGNALANTLLGNSAANTLNGGAGNDTLTGGVGADTFVVGAGTDTITDLGNGADILSVTAGATATATVYAAWAATATTSNSGVANISTSAMAVNLAAVTKGSAGYSVTNTGSATTLTGSALADRLTGGSGNDTLNGGLGTDTLLGGGGADVLYGGSDTVKDVFKFNAASDSTTTVRDKIYNFLTGTDKIDLSGIDANSKVAGDQAFANAPLGTAAKSNAVWYTASGADLIISADTDGLASTVEFQIQMMGITKAALTDFVL